MPNKNKKGVTLDDLANMVARGFESVEQRMVTKEEFQSRTGKIEAKIDDIYEVLTRFEEGDILDLQHRIKILERTVKAIGKRLV
ncbi:MAG: hypothetical protein HYX20_02960 [Candidatus Yanofskybacteria bacterium]|nr:hypothetical protein [Candidatus Yanofskybacteria bacterium]